VTTVVVPRSAWPADRFPQWAVDALRAAGADVRDEGRRADVVLLPAMRPAGRARVRADRAISLIDAPIRPGDQMITAVEIGLEVVATSAVLAAQWPGARVVRPAVAPGEAARAAGDVLRVASVGPLHWTVAHEDVIVAVSRLLATGTRVELRVVGAGPLREAVLFAAFDLRVEAAVTIADGAVPPADVIVVPAVEDRAWPGLIHALASGVPAVATDLPTAREIDGAALVPPRDSAALAEAIVEVALRAAARVSPGDPPARVSRRDPAARFSPRGDLTDLAACGRALLA
jgi:glycosyltransferase involved in cell wall biosynthesis